jgi:hypothetical protein
MINGIPARKTAEIRHFEPLWGGSLALTKGLYSLKKPGLATVSAASDRIYT